MLNMSNLTNENAPLGFEAYSIQALKSHLKLVKPSIRKQLCIVKEKKPKWWYGKKWKQTYSFQDKSKVKSYGLQCVK